MDNSAAESSIDKGSGADTDPGDVEEMDITDMAFVESSTSECSSSSQESFDDDTSQTSDICVISEVSGPEVPVSFFKEGKAKIEVPVSFKVFFNPVQEFNRDLSIAVLTLFAEDHFKEERTPPSKKKSKRGDSSSQNIDDMFTLHLSPGIRYKEGIEVLEALSASGLRSIRYALEVPGVKQITANDMSRSAVLNIENNIELNGVEDIVITSQLDAVWLMQQQKADNLWFDAIDLDPYGCPSKFLDSAVNAVRDGGLLLVTCTDMAVLAGNTPETCHSKYGAISLRNSACHEMALRIALQCIESHCNRYGRYIVPLLSVSADFYIRLFVRVYTSPQKCKQSLSKLSHVFQCNGCCSLTLQPLGTVKDSGNNQFKYTLPNGPVVGETCVHCTHRHHMGGPIWNGPIHDKQFVKRLLELVKKSMDSFETSKRMLGMLTVIDEELPDVPLYYTLRSLCNRVHCVTISLKEFRSALLNAGYEVSSSHCASNSIKTNAPVSVIWDIIRCWVKMHPVAEKRLVDPVCASLLKKEPELIANFDVHPDAMPESIKSGLLRYQPNPAPNWGPGCRSKPNILGLEKMAESKRQHNQNKRKRGHHSTEQSNCNGNDIPIVTLSDDDSMDYNQPLDDSVDSAQSKKQRLSEHDTSSETADSAQVISIDDDEITEVPQVKKVPEVVDMENSEEAAESACCKMGVEIVESSNVGAETEKVAVGISESDAAETNGETEKAEESPESEPTEKAAESTSKSPVPDKIESSAAKSEAQQSSEVDTSSEMKETDKTSQASTVEKPSELEGKAEEVAEMAEQQTTVEKSDQTEGAAEVSETVEAQKSSDNAQTESKTTNPAETVGDTGQDGVTGDPEQKLPESGGKSAETSEAERPADSS